MEQRIKKLEEAMLLLSELILDDARNNGVSWSDYYDPLKSLIEELKDE